MTMITEYPRGSNGLISTSSDTNPKTSALNQKTAQVAIDSLPRYDLLKQCLGKTLNGKISENIIEDVSNSLQNTKIPRHKEHFTIQKELLDWNKSSKVDSYALNTLHLAIRGCKNPANEIQNESHSDK